MNCKVCQSPAKSVITLELTRPDFPKMPLEFFRCTSCDFLFHCAFDEWSDEQMEKFYAYPTYLKYDPGAVTDRRAERTYALIKHVEKRFDMKRPKILMHGNGTCGTFLRLWVEGYDVYATYAPFTFDRAISVGQAVEMGDFDIVCAIEVAEHFVDPYKEFRLVDQMLKDGGVFCGTTCLTDGLNEEPNGEWHYLRQHTINAGHCSIWSMKAFDQMAVIATGRARTWQHVSERGAPELRKISHMPATSVFFQFRK